MKNEDQPHASSNPFQDIPLCGAHSRRTGKPCRQPAMANGRCRLHGGKSTGPPKRNQNALKHGFYTQDAVLGREYISDLLKKAKAVISSGLS